MPRINPVTPESTDPKSVTMLDGVQKALGMKPNLMTTLAHSPAALNAYLGFGQALGGGTLGGKVREQIALAVAGANQCGYCASAHTLLGKGQGVDEDELSRNLQGESEDSRTDAALKFARAIVDNRGFVSDGDLDRVREAGFGEGDIAEIVATVAYNIFTNYFNHVAETEIDFPRVEVGEPAVA